ncbi:MAG: hypothetical protein ACMUIE_10685 [Thermoplasmatota archaeon]
MDSAKGRSIAWASLLFGALFLASSAWNIFDMIAPGGFALVSGGPGGDLIFGLLQLLIGVLYLRGAYMSFRSRPEGISNSLVGWMASIGVLMISLSILIAALLMIIITGEGDPVDVLVQEGGRPVIVLSLLSISLCALFSRYLTRSGKDEDKESGGEPGVC